MQVSLPLIAYIFEIESNLRNLKSFIFQVLLSSCDAWPHKHIVFTTRVRIHETLSRQLMKPWAARKNQIWRRSERKSKQSFDCERARWRKGP
jgi:hypothetical protein